MLSHWKGQRVKLPKLWGKLGKITSIVPLGCSPVEGVIAIVIGFSCLQSLLLLLFCSQYNAECRLFLAPHYVSSLSLSHTHTDAHTHTHFAEETCTPLSFLTPALHRITLILFFWLLVYLFHKSCLAKLRLATFGVAWISQVFLYSWSVTYPSLYRVQSASKWTV